MQVDVSIGELVDKVTILSIKMEKVKDKNKLKNINLEYDLLYKSMLYTDIDDGSKYFKELREVNLKLWDIEDKIRIKEKNQEFGEEFIQLARSVYFENDKRSQIKKEINIKTGSAIVEEKEYVNYQAR